MFIDTVMCGLISLLLIVHVPLQALMLSCDYKCVMDHAKPVGVIVWKRCHAFNWSTYLWDIMLVGMHPCASVLAGMLLWIECSCDGLKSLLWKACQGCAACAGRTSNSSGRRARWRSAEPSHAIQGGRGQERERVAVAERAGLMWAFMPASENKHNTV